MKNLNDFSGLSGYLKTIDSPVVSSKKVSNFTILTTCSFGRV